MAGAIEAALGVGVRVMDPSVHRGTFHWVAFATLEDGRRVVLRVNRLSHPALVSGLRTQIALSGLLATRGITCGSVLASDLSCGALSAEFVITDYMDGTLLAALETHEEDMIGGIRAVGAALKMIHALEGEGAGPVVEVSGDAASGRFDRWWNFVRHRLEEHVSHCVAAGGLTPGEASRVVGEFEAAPLCGSEPTNCLLHGDPGPANVLLVAEGGAVLLDWEDALIGDPVFDLASAALFHPERRWPALFEGYGVDPFECDDFRWRFWIYALRIALARTVMRDRFGILDVPGRTPAVHRISRALEALESGGRP
jgi:aminoglycoside phosphotransferase (APT) family kinase protein